MFPGITSLSNESTSILIPKFCHFFHWPSLLAPQFCLFCFGSKCSESVLLVFFRSIQVHHLVDYLQCIGDFREYMYLEMLIRSQLRTNIRGQTDLEIFKSWW